MYIYIYIYTLRFNGIRMWRLYSNTEKKNANERLGV